MQTLLESLKTWILFHGVPIVFIILAAWLLRKILKAAANRFKGKFEQQGIVASEREKRAKTLSGIIETTIDIAIYVAAGLMIVAEFGVAIGPLVAGAGIAGVALGFGAQSLVKDMITGFFIILENQIRIGDVVNVAGVGGIVEAINLRTTRLRDVEGRVHIIPNGAIEVATNFTREWSRALVEIGVAYKEDVDHVISVLKDVSEELRNDPGFTDLILEPMTVQGLDSFGDSSVNIRMFFKTVPIKQWDVAREFRKRVKKAFDEQGIEIPFPHRTIYMGEGACTGKLQVQAAMSASDNATQDE
ncbi:mechanosensitive ion channel family protein [Thermodesulfobacteriota bacterium]